MSDTSENSAEPKAAPEQSAPDAGRDGKTDAKKDAKAALVSPAESREVILNGEIEILPDKRLPQYDQGMVAAYAARQRGETTRNRYIAYICENSLIPRAHYAPSVAAMLNPALARLVSSGLVYWHPTAGQRYCFVYENNLGNPLMKSLNEPGLGWKHEQVMKAVIKPIVSVLLDMRDVDMAHGNIRPTNLFDGGAKIVERAILGDCLTTPHGYAQPAVFETLSRAMADPVGRGRGTIADDLYALGVTLSFILRHKDPLEGMTEAEVIREKMEQGSYAALTGKDRFTGAILELLRGLLYDDPDQRWTLDDVVSWMDGNRLSPKQSARRIRAARPLAFHGERYLRPELLAMDMPRSQNEASQVIENGALEQWIERSLENKPMLARFHQAVDSSQEGGQGPGYWDRLICKVSIALDPEAPLRYKNLRVTAEGFPYALADIVARKADVTSYVDIINLQIVMYWLNNQTNFRGDMGSIISRFDGARSFLRQNGMGYGVERCIYFLCTEAQCMSDILKHHYVRNPEDLMYAYEQLSRRPNRPHMLIDRHIAAFLSVKDRHVIDPFLVELNATEFHRRILANLKVVAAIQKRSKMDNFPGIASWLSSILKPVLARYHDRDLRKSLKEKIDKIAQGGDLGKIALLLDDNETRQNDFTNFKRSMKKYAELRRELNEVEEKLGKPEEFSREIGQEYAAIASSIIAGIIILVIGFLYFTKSGVL